MWYTVNRINRKEWDNKIDFSCLSDEPRKVQDIPTMSITAKWKRVFKK